MAEKYTYKIIKDNFLYAGYLLHSMRGNNHPPSIFSNLRIIRIVKGEAEITIDKRTYTIKKNDIMILNNLTPRQFSKLMEEELVIEVFAFSIMAIKNESNFLSLYYSKPNSFNPIITHHDDGYDHLNILFDMLKERLKRDNHSQSAVKVVSYLISGINSFIFDIIKNREKNFGTETSGHNISTFEIIAKSINYIFENINQPMNVSLLAKRYNISREYFSRIFKKYVGITPSEFITRCKVDNVIYIIRYNNMNILDAAMEGGFNTSSGFYKAFNSVYKMSPKEYIRKIDL
ncbi:MAG: helix-turn-helix transcriptional regulator [Ruminococcaceae bacterium]|nr:helix-turn-helix transcriptional regulator [Oscillospiraceae bacterium]